MQGHGVEMKQVAGQDRVCLRPQELCPSRTGSSGCGIDPGSAKDLPDGGGSDLVAKPGELAVDAAVAPGGVLGGQAHDQDADTGGDGWSTSADGLDGPTAGYKLPVPAQDRGRCDQQPESATGGYKPGEGSDHGSVGPTHPRPWRASLQHTHLMSQDEDLDLFRRVGASMQHDPAQELREH